MYVFRITCMCKCFSKICSTPIIAMHTRRLLSLQYPDFIDNYQLIRFHIPILQIGTDKSISSKDFDYLSKHSWFATCLGLLFGQRYISNLPKWLAVSSISTSISYRFERYIRLRHRSIQLRYDRKFEAQSEGIT